MVVMTVGLIKQLDLPFNFNPDINILSMQTFSEVCSISFNEDHIKEYINNIYEKMYINFVGICPKTAPSQGYTI